MTRLLHLIPALVAAAMALPATANEIMTTSYEGSFDDAAFSVESAIVGRGLVIDYVSHVGDMLARTKGDVGGEQDLYDGANVYLFCSAVVSRRVMEADPLNIAHCPYGIFVADMGGEIVIGHRTYPEGPMQEVQNLLAEIVAEAAQ